MKALVSKELRLLLPSFGLGVVLSLSPLWLSLWQGVLSVDTSSVFLFSAGVLLVSLTAIGRELTNGTLALQLAQPISRQKIWWCKTSLLALLLLMMLALWGWSYRQLVALVVLVYDYNALMQPVREAVLSTLLITGAAFSGALWTTLLFRQLAASFWFTLLIPLSIFFFVSEWNTKAAWFGVEAYTIVGFAYGYRLFIRATDFGWTGGEISLFKPRSTQTGLAHCRRHWRPIVAMLWKEVQLHQFTLLGIGFMAIVHVCAVLFTKFAPHLSAIQRSSAITTAYVLWAVLATLIAAEAVSEERKFGVISGLLCFPVRSRTQLIIKWVVVAIPAVLVCPFMAWAIDGWARNIGAEFMFRERFDSANLEWLIAGSLGLTFIAFYCSSLARSVLHAIGLTLPALVAVSLFAVVVMDHGGPDRNPIWRGEADLGRFIVWPALVLVLIWLIFRNFRLLTGNGLVWKPNFVWIAATLVVSCSVTGALYNRIWELCAPGPAPVGSALFKPGERLTIDHQPGGTVMLLPDGRLRVQRLEYVPGKPVLGTNELVRREGWWGKFSCSYDYGGSNWIGAYASPYAVTAIRSDGTLWDSGAQEGWKQIPRDAPDLQRHLLQYGSEADWQKVFSTDVQAALLLKTNGTLWRWGPASWIYDRRQLPAMSTFQPQRIGSVSNIVQAITTGGFILAWDREQHAWLLSQRHQEGSMIYALNEYSSYRTTNFDGPPIVSLTERSWIKACVRGDGRLYRVVHEYVNGMSEVDSVRRWRFAPIGSETNWLQVVGEEQVMMALKRDGSLWRWVGHERNGDSDWLALSNAQQIGSKMTWVALTDGSEGAFAASSNGILWHWWYPDSDEYIRHYFTQRLLAPPRHPDKVEDLITGKLF